MRSLSLLLLLLLASICEVATVSRCEDTSGHVSFTQLGCSAGQADETVVTDNPSSGGKSATPTAEMRTKKVSIDRESAPLAVIREGEDRCGRRLDERERCGTTVEQRIMAGMAHSDVERALGKPDQVSGNNAEVRYQYEADKRRGARSVNFDQEGYVKGEGRRRMGRVGPGS